MTTKITINKTSNDKKRQCHILAEHLRQMGLKKEAFELDNCSTCVTYAVFEDYKIVTDIRMCQKRYCPLCGDYKRKQHTKIMSCIIDHLFQSNTKLIVVSLEFTLRNNGVNNIKEDNQILKNAWSKITKAKAIKDKLLGYAYYLHPKYNIQNEEDDMNMHNHMHLLIFFKNISKEFVKEEYWRDIFKKRANLSYYPHVHLRFLNNKEEIMKKVYYAARPIEIQHIPKVDIANYLKQLKKQRLITISQSLRAISKQLIDKHTRDFKGELKSYARKYWAKDHYEIIEF